MCNYFVFLFSSPPSTLPLAQGFFMPAHPPHLNYYEGSPPFSPPLPQMFPPFVYPSYFPSHYTSSGVGYIPPTQQVPPMVQYNAAN